MGHKIHYSCNYLGYLDMRARKVLNVTNKVMNILKVRNVRNVMKVSMKTMACCHERSWYDKWMTQQATEGKELLRQPKVLLVIILLVLLLFSETSGQLLFHSIKRRFLATSFVQLLFQTLHCTMYNINTVYNYILLCAVDTVPPHHQQFSNWMSAEPKM